MPRRNSPADIATLDDLGQFAEIVVDKRQDKRANAKRSRRNRHYERQFLRSATGLPVANADDGDP
ncbi:MAG: hypothetical protein C0434_17160 [Xanthomonadaceae bacterium]|nr:hypothetical protein [Xanthomonadaceae bacterium]